tara:strand:- start:252 stop:587 length:336 start_codon:yes stop_codon:yes gene_type:complete
MKYAYLDLKPLPQRPIKEHVYVSTEKDKALSAKMFELADRIEKQLEGRWRPSIGDKVIYADKDTEPLGYLGNEQGTVTYLGNGWFQVTWDNIGLRSYGLSCVVQDWIILAP